MSYLLPSSITALRLLALYPPTDSSLLHSDLIFPIPHLISFLSQGTTLRAGTLILTGTPAGIGFFFNPPDILLDGDEFRVEVDGGIGSLIVEYEKVESKA
jgi:2-keto-4-pentenoate hydratase/2-oxohepta-3-ene-1,7-dioic acid hydratase in catechol pathway